MNNNDKPAAPSPDGTMPTIPPAERIELVNSIIDCDLVRRWCMYESQMLAMIARSPIESVEVFARTLATSGITDDKLRRDLEEHEIFLLAQEDRGDANDH